jgi:hypothetical protein
MRIRRVVLTAALLGTAAAGAITTEAQDCAASQDAAVGCFVNNALRTKLTVLRYGMTVPEFESYGVAVSKILQDQQTYLVVTGIATAVADAMPPTNANGTANPAAQQTAIDSIVSAEISDRLVTVPAETSEQDMIWFSQDMVAALNTSTGVLLSPGAMLRVLDSYVVAATSGGTVNWSKVNASLATLIDTLISAHLLKLPSTVTQSQVQSFSQSLAHAIYTYKVATNRATL